MFCFVLSKNISNHVINIIFSCIIYIFSVYISFTMFILSLNIVYRTIPLEERSRAVSFVFGGLSFGSVTGYISF